MNEYFILKFSDDIKYCVVAFNSVFINEYKGWRIDYALEMAHRYPDNGVTFRMSDENSGIVVPDYIKNHHFYSMISDRLKSIFETTSFAEIEFLPFHLLNHKGRTVSGNFFIANILTKVDCIDFENTVCRTSKSEPGMITGLKKLSIDIKKVPSTLKLFRLSQELNTIIVRDDLKETLINRQTTGIDFVGMGKEI
ncbi:MAG: hypothetical protein HKP58_03155 [Desulfatitalea sp.]|nr:hypothetical protein [Desulfatitalea sp.]NNJ99390.1 hypothetical protein [Desulfatitalea sp.]